MSSESHPRDKKNLMLMSVVILTCSNNRKQCRPFPSASKIRYGWTASAFAVSVAYYCITFSFWGYRKCRHIPGAPIFPCDRFFSVAKTEPTKNHQHTRGNHTPIIAALQPLLPLPPLLPPPHPRIVTGSNRYTGLPRHHTTKERLQATRRYQGHH